MPIHFSQTKFWNDWCNKWFHSQLSVNMTNEIYIHGTLIISLWKKNHKYFVYKLERFIEGFYSEIWINWKWKAKWAFREKKPILQFRTAKCLTFTWAIHVFTGRFNLFRSLLCDVFSNEMPTFIYLYHLILASIIHFGVIVTIIKRCSYG